MHRIVLAAWLLVALGSNGCARAATPEEQAAAVAEAVAAPALTGTLPAALSSLPAATDPNEQVYIDPAGWYALDLPANWQATGQPGAFRGADGFFESGYLPEMMFMENALDVCQWLANVATKEAYWVYWPGTHGGCKLLSLPDSTPAAVLEIVENPAADLSQRYLYVKSDPAHFDRITSTFAWLRPVAGATEPALHLAPLRPEDSAFWETATPPAGRVSIKEYELPGEAQKESPAEKIFLEFVPPEALPESKPGTVRSGDTLEDVNGKIAPFGYELRAGVHAHLYQLYRDDALLLEHIYELPAVYRFPTPQGEKLAFLAYALVDPELGPYTAGNAAAYLVQDDAMTRWGDGPRNPMDPGLAPILCKGELLWMQVVENTHVVVKNSRGEALFSFGTYYGSRLPVNGFRAWDDHWILEVSDFVVQDGVILNEAHGFEEVFDWRAVHDRPFYFFRKGARISLSYAGGVLPTYYHHVAHGLCCGLALNNPRIDENTVRFFGEREGVWYYVVVTVY